MPELWRLDQLQVCVVGIENHQARADQACHLRQLLIGRLAARHAERQPVVERHNSDALLGYQLCRQNAVEPARKQADGFGLAARDHSPASLPLCGQILGVITLVLRPALPSFTMRDSSPRVSGVKTDGP